MVHQLDTGRYTITNVGTNNVAILADANTESCISGGPRQDSDGEKWNIVLLNNKKYTIKSYAAGRYANYEPNPKVEEHIFVTDRAQQWKIKEMRTPGHYVIFPENTHCYWGLPDGEEGSPITFSEHSNHPKNVWFFTKVEDEDKGAVAFGNDLDEKGNFKKTGGGWFSGFKSGFKRLIGIE